MKVEVIDQKQGNRYDKIIKENMDAALPGIMKDVLNLEVSNSEAIPDSIQYTKERRPDVLKKITDRNNNEYVLHIEWQSQNDKNMAYRMAEYAVMLYRKYRIPVEQYVIFIGKGGVKMSSELKHKNLQFRYEIIDFKKFDYKLFLHSEKPAIKVFAILANFEEDGEDKAVENICNEIRTADDKGSTGNKYFNQLRVLMNIRNTNIKLKFKKMLSVKTFYTKETDVLYLIGKEDTQKEIATNLKTLGIDIALISQAAGLSIEEIERLN
ncbi:conserved hypothetical protein (putative transposase or invertase) [Chitinophaga sp. CF118]|uniref:Rpn family recombination-promoting nuclease/putative transposase n=1 Tax=Chitinophaga sp. CF118 TaxID=1884367 RepID=UPI0008E669D6|nr:Rpn family recombination-promoting nuclease/putative transposase [Chitinophaga sp. CF118]SFD01776.1 conserved hypothetical protein (putative transposase or invertase) [Chitinophaga sp. CF118]